MCVPLLHPLPTTVAGSPILADPSAGIATEPRATPRRGRDSSCSCAPDTGAHRNRRGHGASRRRRSAGGRPPSAERGRGHDRGLGAVRVSSLGGESAFGESGRILAADGASAAALRPRPRRITQSGVSRFPGTTPAMRPPDRLGGRAARGPLPSGTPSTRIRGAGRRTRGPRIRPGGAAPPPGGP